MTLLCIIVAVACRCGIAGRGARTRSILSNYVPVNFDDKGADEETAFTAPVHNCGE